MTTSVRGECESGYGRLADLLAERLRSGREIGASIGVYRDGRPVVEIWGGHTDRGRLQPWTGDTVTPLASSTKALATAAVLVLVDRGQLDLDRPVAHYWPAFGAAGKAEITTALARLFAALGGSVDGTRLLNAKLMNRARIPHASGRDHVSRMRTDWGLGFALPGGPMMPDLGVPGVFGHTGASGSFCFADPDHQLAFGYTPNYWSELSGRGRATFRFTAYAEAAYTAAGIRRWPAQSTR